MRRRIWAFIVTLIVFLAAGSIQNVSLAQSGSDDDGVDFMIICAHPGDEYLYLGGALPLYAGEQGRTAVVVYLSSTDETQRQAAEDGLARFGDNVRAVFGSFSSVYTSTEEEALKYWKKADVTAYLVDLIREYKPVVVISHDSLGEYGHGAHCVASDCALLAVSSAAKEDQSESAAQYGLWQVQRLFLHRYGEDLVVLDRSQPLSHFDGQTALELDQQGYETYPETYPIEISDEAGYTRAEYGLAYAADDSSFDSSSGDLFSGLDDSILSPTATPVPTPTPTPTETPEPTPTIAVSPATDSEESSQQRLDDLAARLEKSDYIALGVLGVLAVASLLGLCIAAGRETRNKSALILCIVILLSSPFLIWHVLSSSNTDRSALDGTDTPSPAATASPTPTLSAEPTDTPEPTPTPDPWDAYFRSDSDPEEVVVNDQDNEHWEYRSDDLSVIIDRVHITRADGKPICYCVAQIRMRNEDAFRAGLDTEYDNAPNRPELPCTLARRYRAVLAITGDNLTHAETETKGILIRNGKVYSANQAQDTLAFYSDDLSVKVFKAKTVTAQELIDQGVLNTFSFGPTLLVDGVRDLESKRSQLGRANPRCGIGMVEPGYYIAITVDGRQSDHSVGMSLDEFAQLFYFYGCELAYNLDGGSSTAMVFMGECLSQHSGVGSDLQRPWVDALLWGNSELVPTTDDPVYNDGGEPWEPIP